MSIKLTNNIFTNGFMEALQVIDNTEDLPNQFAWDICLFVTEYETKLGAFQKKRKQILEKNCIKNEDGTPKFTESKQILPDGSEKPVQNYTYEDDGQEEKEIKAVRDLEKCEIQFKSFNKFKINLSEFKTMPKPKYLRALNGILDVRK